MNSYHNYAYWRAKQQNKKTRLAQWPTSPQDPEGSTETEYTEPGGHYEISVTPSIYETSDPYYTEYGDQLMDIYGDKREDAPAQHNGPYLSMSVARNLVPTTFKLLHHLFNSHTNLMKPNKKTTFQHFHREGDNVDHRAQHEASSTYGSIRKPEDLTNHLSHMFSNFLLLHMNNADTPISHPGRDFAIDNHTGQSGNPDITAQEKIKNRTPQADYLQDNLAVRERYKKLLHSFLDHHIKNPSASTSFASFMDRQKEHPEVFTSFIKDVLAGKFNRK